MSAYKGANNLQILSVYSILYSMLHRYTVFLQLKEMIEE